MNTPTHETFMRMAIEQAKAALAQDEVPCGCVIVNTKPDDTPDAPTVIARAHNQTELLKDPTAHAEMIAIPQAANAIGDWRLTTTILYVTKEPCVMCAGAIILARIPTVVFGCPDPQRGGACSVFNVLDNPSLNHRAEIISGVLGDECLHMIQSCFRDKRAKQKNHASDLKSADA